VIRASIGDQRRIDPVSSLRRRMVTRRQTGRTASCGRERVELIGWLILGGAAGWLAGKLVRGSGNGILVNVLVGIVGAVLGGWLASLALGVNITEGFNIATFAVAVVGAVLLLGLANLLGMGRKRAG
jgi:uncharacterized membrane protein YeaQ/YmgE (transglycosylase-associated protein family)